MSNTVQETAVQVKPPEMLAYGEDGKSPSRIDAIIRPTEPTPVERKLASVQGPLRHDPTITLRFLGHLFAPGSVIEQRVIRGFRQNGFIVPASTQQVLSGWYDNPHDLNLDAGRLRGVSTYVTANPCNPDLLARSYNKLTRTQDATRADDVTVLRWLFIDVDPIRLPGISATEEERSLALGRRDAILKAIPGMAEASLTGSSGNGAYILVRLPDLANDDTGRKLIADALKIIAAQHDGDGAEIDQKTKDPSRIMALPGTWKCKGSNIPHRPWRIATLDGVPTAGRTLDLAGFVAEHSALLPSERRRSSRDAVPSPPGRVTGGSDRAHRLSRAAAYIATKEPAVSGQNGHGKTFDVACSLIKGFDLTVAEATPIIADWNRRCQPPWDDADLRRKLEQADSKVDDRPRGFLFDAPSPGAPSMGGATVGDAVFTLPWEEGDNQTPATIESAVPAALAGVASEGVPIPEEFVGDPHMIARAFLGRYSHPDGSTLRFWQSAHWEWRGGAWTQKPEKELRGEINQFMGDRFLKAYGDALAAWKASGGKENEKPGLRPVTSTAVGNTLGAIEGNSAVMLAQRDYDAMPVWLDGSGEGLPAAEMLAFGDALIHAPSFASGNRKILSPTPRFFNANALDYAFDPDAPEPTRFLAFLDQLWPGDRESIDCLQEWFGLQLVPVTKYQKMMAFIGPPRAGKGVLLRLMQKLVGRANSVGLTLGKLENNFGLQSLIGKLSAIIDDARISGQSNLPLITESLLTLSGEGLMSVGRKHRADWEGKLTARITLASNELPRLPDSSGALTARFIVLRFSRSFLGQEDLGLDAELEAELPGILLWALGGLARLTERGRFVPPASGAELHGEFEGLASPISSFLADCCTLGPEEKVEKKTLYGAWRAWCEANGREKPGELAVFSRNLRAAVSGLSDTKLRDGDRRTRMLNGVGLIPQPEEASGQSESEFIDHRGNLV